MTTNESHIEIRQRFAAAPEKVFAAFADARLITRWLTPSPDVTLSVLNFDFREGGSYRFCYHLQNGQTVIVGGFYTLVEPPSKIVFSWIIEPPDEHAGIESEVTVTISQDEGGTELVIRHEKLTHTRAVVRHTEGWYGALRQMAAMLEEEEEKAHGR
jgi:uncharacterized protein YndB with AHSA1/START domain